MHILPVLFLSSKGLFAKMETVYVKIEPDGDCETGLEFQKIPYLEAKVKSYLIYLYR